MANKIHKINTMAEIKPHVADADLIIFDIDHTIVEAKTPYCHSNWFYDLYEEGIAKGLSEKEVLNAIVEPWESSQRDCQVKAVEPFIPALIHDAQKSQKRVMALTARSPKIADATISQLDSLGIDFSFSAPGKTDMAWFLGQNVSSKNGVVFVSDYLPKGMVLKDYLEKTAFKPRRVLFVDDSFPNLVSVKETLEKDGIAVDTFFYPFVKRSAPHWDKELAKREFEARHGKVFQNN
jgi:FMN phosphatase YigB (HAD superfamily)